MIDNDVDNYKKKKNEQFDRTDNKKLWIFPTRIMTCHKCNLLQMQTV